MATFWERRMAGAILLSFGVAQYTITIRKVWHALLPSWWFNPARKGGLLDLVPQEIFPHEVLLLLGPIVLVVVGASLLISSRITVRVWSLTVGALGSLVALAVTISAWRLAVFLPLLVVYLSALIWAGVRAYPRLQSLTRT